MLPQLFDYADSLLAQRLLHGFILGINGTGHGKILPYQYPFFIADVKELFILIDIAAPAAHRIAADLVHHIQHRRNPLGITGMQRIRRHPVGTQDKDRFAVHAEIELPFGIFSAGRMVDEIHRPQSRPEGAGVHRLSAVLQRYRHIIHRLFAAALGPPEMHLCDLAVQLTGVEPGGIAHGKAAVAAASLAADGVIPKLTLVVLEGIIQRDISPSVFQIDVLRHEIGFLDMGLRAVFQLDRPPQAARKNTGRNVPAEHVRCLADIEGRSVIFHGDGAQGRPVLLRLQQGGADMYDNIGFAVRKPFHRNRVRNQHIVAFINQPTVDINVRIGVDPFEHQPRGRSLLGFELEASEIQQMAILIGIQLQDIVSEEDIRKLACSLQIQFEIAGYRGGNGGELLLPYRLDHILLHCAQISVMNQGQPPSAVQYNRIPVIQENSSLWPMLTHSIAGRITRRSFLIIPNLITILQSFLHIFRINFHHIIEAKRTRSMIGK